MQITVSGYKSISAPRSVDVKGITILSGANSSGKSSFMQPLLLIKQTVESEFDSGGLMLDGANVKMTDSSQARSLVRGRASPSIGVKVDDFDGGNFVEVVFTYRQSKGLLASLLRGGVAGGDAMTLKERMSEASIKKELRNSQWRDLYKAVLSNKKWSLKVIRDRCFFSVGLAPPINGAGYMSFGIEPASRLKSLVSALIHVPGLRGNPERSYKVAASSNRFPGTFDRYVASTIHGWQEENDEKIEHLAAQLSALALASAVRTVAMNDTRIQIQVSRVRSVGSSEKPDDLVDIADVGFGVSQTLPVLVALLAAKPDQMVYIEQPELHLHPRAQFGLAQIISDAVSRGVKVIIETHSSILIRGVQILVAKGVLEGKSVSLNWFSQNPRSGQSEVKAAQLDNYGRFGDWPEDFDSVILDVEEQYLDAVEEAMSDENR